MITLKWKLHTVLGCDYYYTFHGDKFWCIKAEFVVNGFVTATDSIFQVTVHKMEKNSKERLLQRLTNLFPELALFQIKKTLQYDPEISF